jgi:hypothetical protein
MNYRQNSKLWIIFCFLHFKFELFLKFKMNFILDWIPGQNCLKYFEFFWHQYISDKIWFPAQNKFFFINSRKISNLFQAILLYRLTSSLIFMTKFFSFVRFDIKKLYFKNLFKRCVNTSFCFSYFWRKSWHKIY